MSKEPSFDGGLGLSSLGDINWMTYSRFHHFPIVFVLISPNDISYYIISRHALKQQVPSQKFIIGT